LKYQGINTKFLPSLRRLSKHYKLQFYSEDDFVNDCKPFRDIIILNGYFQDYHLFNSIRPQLINLFAPKKKLSIRNKLLLRSILDSNSVSMHFRGGVYLTDEKIRKLYPPVNFSYYQKAFELINSQNRNARFFVFTNDKSRANKLHILGESVTVVETQGPDYEHLYLMSQCKHNIITNSTFSWWGAWLNNNPDKIVITTKKWEQSHARIPETWIQLDN